MWHYVFGLGLCFVAGLVASSSRQGIIAVILGQLGMAILLIGGK